MSRITERRSAIGNKTNTANKTKTANKVNKTNKTNHGSETNHGNETNHGSEAAASNERGDLDPNDEKTEERDEGNGDEGDEAEEEGADEEEVDLGQRFLFYAKVINDKPLSLSLSLSYFLTLSRSLFFFPCTTVCCLWLYLLSSPFSLFQYFFLLFSSFLSQTRRIVITKNQPTSLRGITPSMCIHRPPTSNFNAIYSLFKAGEEDMASLYDAAHVVLDAFPVSGYITRSQSRFNFCRSLRVIKATQKAQLARFRKANFRASLLFVTPFISSCLPFFSSLCLLYRLSLSLSRLSLSLFIVSF